MACIISRVDCTLPIEDWGFKMRLRLLVLVGLLVIPPAAASAAGCDSSCHQPPDVCVFSCGAYTCEHGGIERFQDLAKKCGAVEYSVGDVKYKLHSTKVDQ